MLVDVSPDCLPRVFYARATVVVARALLGQRLVRTIDGVRLSGLITETEAYGGSDDQASHAYRHTARSAIMYGPPGHAYVYFIYGMYYCLNAVTEEEGRPGAVLIRAILPEEGVARMRSWRGGAPLARLADGPGKLCQSLEITLSMNGVDLVSGAPLFVERGRVVPEADVRITPRINVRGDASAIERPWRFLWTPRGQG